MFLVDFSEFSLDDLGEISKAKYPWETIEDFILRATREKIESLEKRNVVPFKRKTDGGIK